MDELVTKYLNESLEIVKNRYYKQYDSIYKITFFDITSDLLLSPAFQVNLPKSWSELRGFLTVVSGSYFDKKEIYKDDPKCLKIIQEKYEDDILYGHHFCIQQYLNEMNSDEIFNRYPHSLNYINIELNKLFLNPVNNESDRRFKFESLIAEIDLEFYDQYDIFNTMPKYLLFKEIVYRIDKIYYNGYYFGIQSENVEKLNWIGNLNQLTTLFKDLISGDNNNGKKFIKIDNTEALIRTLMKTFLINGKPIKENTLDGYFRKGDKDVKGSKRLKLRD